MSDLLDRIANEPDLLERMSNVPKDSRPFDPSEAPLHPRPPVKYLVPKEKTDKVMGLFRKGMWTGLGVIAWPFERIEYTLATPITKMLEERKKTLADEGIEKGFALYEPRLISSEDMRRESIETLKTLKLVGQAWMSKTPPEGVKTFNDVFGSYYEGLTGEPAPEWYKTIAGGGASILVVPFLFGKLLKGIGAGAKATGIPQRISARRLPAWQNMKKLARLETGAKITDAQGIGKSLANKQIRKLAKELSTRTGRNITPRAVKLRLTQIIKGGVTSQPELAAKANPVIEEFTRMSAELKRLKILPEYTYISKLPKRKVAELLKQRANLQKQLTGLEKVTGKEGLLKAAEKLSPDIKGQQRLVDKFIKVAIKAEERGLKLSQIGDDFIDVAIEVNTGSPLAKKVASLLDFAPGDKRLSILGKRILSLEKMERTSRIKAADEIIKTASKINPKVSKYVNQTIKDILKAAEEIENYKVIGKAPLLKKIKSMKRTFPGKAKKTEELTGKIAKISESLQQQYHLGGEQYFPRMYLSKEEAQAARRFPLYSKERVSAQFAKQRKKIPEDVRKAMGEIREPAHPVMKRMIQESSAIETGKLFEFAAGNPKWVSSEWIPGFVKKALPDTKAYGALRGKFVYPTIHSDVTALLRTKSDIEALYDTGIGTWKLGKTVWNPAVHFRNMFSNSVLLDLSGLDHIQQAKYMGKALKHIRTNSKEYQEARRYFMRTTMVHGELLDDMLKGFKETEGSGLRNIIGGLNKTVSKASATPSQIYQAEEFTGKFIKYLEQREKGKSVIEAVQEANKWLFDYSDLANWEKNIARRVMPFYTFPRKAVPRVIEAAANRPLVLAKYPMIAKSLTQYSLHKLDLTTKDYATIEKDLPQFMNQGSYVLMPYRDANGDLRFFDWTWNVPWGGLFEAEQRGLLKSVVTNPLAQIIFEIKENKSSWTGRKIWDDAIPEDKWTPAYRKEQNLKKMLYVWQALSPSLAYKGIYWDKIVGAATGKKARGKDILLPEAIAHTIFGVRTQAVDTVESRRWKLLNAAKGFDELRGNMVRILMQQSNGDITVEEFDKKWKVYADQLQSYHLDAITEEEDAPTSEEILGLIRDMQENPEDFEEEKKD
ncbi:hypothetical protein LCGC14_1387740 [marine sediment metagenome]|uniref:Uncharacterized protein n=1 Tax=marine sediment metagenome TaxID=412755 RepID=A0A0F9MGE1_9ZZZZ